MPLTALFDLDDTLLNTHLDTFLPAYFESLSQSLSQIASPEKIAQMVNFAVSQMSANENPGKMLKEIFSENFYPQLGITEAACRDLIDHYYQHVFPNLQAHTEIKPEAASLIDWCSSQNMAIGVATNPLFPQAATRQRIEWAGLNSGDFQFYSTYDDFHFTKPHLAYYAECLGRMGWQEGSIVMVGDDLTQDILPMESLGFATFWVTPSDEKINRPHGQLSDVQPWLEAIATLDAPAPSKTPDALIAILRATPAVIDTALRNTPAIALKEKSVGETMNVVELLWLMADLERDVYLPQWQHVQTDHSTPIEHVASKDWVTSRRYQSREPQAAYEQLLDSRMASLSILRDLYEKGLFTKIVHHPVLKQTTVAELVSFSADQDRDHLREFQNLLNIYKIY